MGNIGKRKHKKNNFLAEINMTNIITIILFIVSAGFNVYQYYDNRENREETENHNRLTEKFNFELSMGSPQPYKILLGDTNEEKEVSFPAPTLRTITGFPGSRMITIIYGEKVIKSLVLPTQNFLREADIKGDYNSYEINMGVKPLPTGSYGDGLYGAHYFLTTNGMDESQKIHIVTYTFQKDENGITCKSSKIYEEIEMRNIFEVGSYMEFVQKDYEYFKTHFISE